jgi:hypothetical protein
MPATQQEQAVLYAFFEYLFGTDEGYVVIATIRPPARNDTFKEQYFEWPRKQNEMLEYIDLVTPTHNVYFCINVLSTPRRKKSNAIAQNLIWADLDTAPPDQLEIPPQCVIESSPNRFQGIWRLDQKIDPALASQYAKRIAYLHADLGVDKSGHDVTQLLRVPGTYNFKYQFESDSPRVELRSMVDTLLPIDLFEALPPAHVTDEDIENIPVPYGDELPSPEMILHKKENVLIQLGLKPAFARYYTEEPLQDWSSSLWALLGICFDAGMEAVEAFVIAKNAKCNKYERDNRPDSHLWRDVLKKQVEHEINLSVFAPTKSLELPQLLTTSETDSLNGSVIDDYMEWATEVTDAVPVFHELGCAVLLSSLMSTTLRLPAGSFKIVPNLWGMILGDSTLTRKTTAMDMAIEFVHNIDQDLILGSDTTAEGLMSSLSLRPKQVSIFYRDEITGFFNAVRRKEYMSTVPEIMTKLYDVPQYFVRRLRKDTYTMAEPIFIFFGGGIRDRMYSLIEEDFITSGFIPRFLIVNGYADGMNVRTLGPPQESGRHKREQLLNTFRALHHMYTEPEAIVQDPTGSSVVITPEIEVMFPSSVWTRAAEMEMALNDAASRSIDSNKALPCFSRMYISLLKLTMLLAAARQEPTDFKVLASLDDLLNAASYIQRWGRHTVDVILNSGMVGDEVTIRAIYRLVEQHPGIMRSQISRHFHLDAVMSQRHEETLVQRLMIQVVTHGKTKKYYPIGR